MDPRSEYARHLAVRRDLAEREERLFRRIGNARLAVAIAGVGVAFCIFGEMWISPWWLPIPIAVFLGLAIVHARVVNRMNRARRAAVFYEWGLARLDNQWMGRGETGERFRNPEHVYADDLDLFGKASLFELLCQSRTRGGEDALAGWLLAPSSREEAQNRQESVAELRPGVDLREDVAVLGEPIRAELHPEALAAWGEAPRVHFPRSARAIALVLSTAVVVTLALYFFGPLTRTPFLVALLVALAYGFSLRKGVNAVNDKVESPARDLGLLSDLLRRIELEQFHSTRLRELRAQLDVERLVASVQIARLRRLVVRLDWQRNQFFLPLAAAVLWSTHLAMAIERWRIVAGPSIRAWITTIGEIEALLSLSCYAYEHPADPFPELTEESAWFEAEGLGHPLMREEQCVRNDLKLGGERRLFVVSGSNMSGKSTLLRSVGVNTVLAWAGAPVRAKRLVVSPLAVGASIRAQDSLQDGRSRFYAEITRLRQIVELTNGQRTVLFLIDELLSGTNSHDRRIGAEAIVRSLVDRGAIGLLTTHDLALAGIADSLNGYGMNVHFADTIEDSKLHFDYRLHPGVVERSNALELMRSVGLEV